MGDVALEWSTGTIGLALRSDDVASDEGLRTAVLLSLFTDRRAESDDALPSGDGDRRGWWADEFASTEDDRVGSRLWLLDRSKRRDEVARDAEEFVREALAWSLEDRVASRVDVEAETFLDGLLIEVVMHRPGAEAIGFRFAHVWEGEALQSLHTDTEVKPTPLFKEGSVHTFGDGLIDRRGALALARSAPGRHLSAFLNQLGWFG